MFLIAFCNYPTSTNTCKQLPLTKDLNSGNPIGMGLAPSTYANGLRFSAAEAYLDDAPKNLTVIPDVAVSRVLFEGKKAIGIETSEGLKRTYLTTTTM